MSEHLHEMVDPGTIKTIGQLINATGEGINVLKGNKSKISSKDSYSFSSAAKAASKLIAVFPILISRSVDFNTASMVSKYIEQKACIMLQIALQQLNISNAENGVEYLKRFHQNLNIGGDDVAALGSVIDAMIGDISNTRRVQHNSATLSDSMLEEKLYDMIDWDRLLENDNSIRISNQQMKELMEMFADAEKYQIYDTQLNERSINDFIVKESARDYRVSIKAFNEVDITLPHSDIVADDDYWDRYQKTRKIYDNIQKDKDREEDRKNKREDKEREKQEAINKIKNRTGQVTFLRDQDIKKMNAAVPSLIIVKFYNSSDATVATEFIIGVKSKVLAINADEILRRIANDNKDGKSFINLMRTITGELKMTDFLFGLSRIKENLKSTRIKGAYGDVWNLLQNRAVAAKTAISRGERNNFAAITTVVISRDDADNLFKEENLDITNPKVARHFMESYNLLGFAIVDDAVESIKFLFDDGSIDFEEFSYKMLARETEADTYKSMLKLIANNR